MYVFKMNKMKKLNNSKLLKMKRLTSILLLGLGMILNINGQIPTEGLVGYWSFSGNANDESGNGNHGVVNGASLTTDRFDNPNSAYSFDGLNDFIEILDSPELKFSDTDLTISCWVELDTYSTDFLSSIVSRRTSSTGGNGYMLLITGIQGVPNGAVTYTVSGGADPESYSKDSILLNSWYHIAVSFDNSTNELSTYINGELDTISSGIYSPNSVNANLFLGKDDWLNRYFWDGKLDDIRFYNRALNKIEVESLYSEGGWSSLNQGLLAYFPFNGNAVDESGNGNDGTIYGATLTEDRFGKLNRAFSFDQTHISIQDNPTLDFTNKFSICAWFENKNTSPLVQTIVGKPRYDGGSGYYLQLGNAGQETPSLIFGINSGSSPFGGNCHFVSENLTTGWHSVMGTYDGEQIKLYVDGILKDSSSTSVSLPNSDYPLYIGRENGSIDTPVPSGDTVRYFYGKIDDVRLYNHALSSFEVQQLFNESMCFVTIYDTIPIYDTTFVTIQDTLTTEVYDSIMVTDTLIIDAVLTGVDAPDNINTLIIYPNPAKDHVFINTGDYTRMNGYSIKIINQVGVTVFETNIEEPLYEVNLSSWSGNGLYFVQVIDSGGNIIDIRKIIIQ